MSLGFLSAWGQTSIEVVNQSPESVKVLDSAAKALDWNLVPARPANVKLNATVLAWEAREGKDSSLTKARADEIEAYVKNGGNLLVSCGVLTWAELYRLTRVLPTTGWHGLTARPPEAEQKLKPNVRVGDRDPSFLPGVDLSGNEVGYHYSIRPFHQVERGMHRYERYPMTWRHLAKSYIFSLADKSYEKPADHVFWTRPLMNRQWQSPILVDSVDGSALLMTGRYGKGKVAVFASGIAETAEWKQRDAFWAGVLKWLATPEKFTEAAPPEIKASAQERVAVSANGKGLRTELLQDGGARSVGLRLVNNSSAPLPAEAVLRVATWQRALIGDLNARVIVPAGGERIIRWSIPAPEKTSYQALTELDEYDVRFGVLAGDGSEMLAGEARGRVNFAQPLRVDVRADNLYTVMKYPFPGSAMDSPQGGGILHFAARMGHPTHAYAYKPGATVNASIEITSGLRNLAPLAKVTDELDAENLSVCAINDQGGSYNQNPASGDGIVGYSDWRGKVKEVNVLRFDFSEPVTISMITLNGNAKVLKVREDAETFNPGAVIVEVDGKKVATVTDLDAQFRASHGRAFVSFPPVSGRQVRLIFPWVPTVSGSGESRAIPRLADVELGGSVSGVFPPALRADADWKVLDALTGQTISTGRVPVSVPSAGRATAAFSFKTPTLDNTGDIRPLRIEVTAGGVTSSIPIMVIDPQRFFKPLTPRLTDFYATQGVRRCFPLGTGTREKVLEPQSVAQPDDQVWSYSRHLQDDSDFRADRMFANGVGIEYIPQGWIPFNNGEPFLDMALPHLIAQGLEQARLTGNKKQSIMFSDHWHASPQLEQMKAWQHLVEFDDWLRSKGKPGLKGKTHSEVWKEINQQREHDWTVWNLEFYMDRLRAMRDGFAKAGLELVIHSQNFPVVPSEYAEEVASIVSECNNDATWVMVADSEALTTGRQMVQKIINPYYKWATLLNWGWVSSMLGSPTWQHPVGTSETSRRKYLNLAWPGTLDFEGNYFPMNEFGLKQNGLHAFNLGTHEWQEWWKLAEQMTFLWPERPLGPGFVFSNDKFSIAQKPILGVGEFTLRDHPSLNSPIFAWRAFSENGIPVTFGANAKSLGKYSMDRGLILVNVSEFSDKEVDDLIKLNARGIGLVATMGGDALPPKLANLFGVTPSGSPTTGKSVGKVDGRDIVRNGKTLFYPLKFAEYTSENLNQAQNDLIEVLDSPLQLPTGVTGYAHYRGKQLFIVLEDRLEKGRVLDVRLRASADGKAPTACLMVDHSPIKVTRDGNGWKLEVPTRPGDGNVVCVEGYQQ